jgi:hypothetical protein
MSNILFGAFGPLRRATVNAHWQLEEQPYNLDAVSPLTARLPPLDGGHRDLTLIPTLTGHILVLKATAFSEAAGFSALSGPITIRVGRLYRRQLDR